MTEKLQDVKKELNNNLEKVSKGLTKTFMDYQKTEEKEK